MTSELVLLLLALLAPTGLAQTPSSLSVTQQEINFSR